MNILTKLSMATAGATFISTMGVMSAPAQAALLDFSWKTIQARYGGSFTLDTSVMDTPLSSSQDLYPKAISNLTVGGSNFGSSDLLTTQQSYNNTPVTGLGTVYDLNQPQASTLGIYFTGKSLTNNVSGSKKLSDDPSTYMSAFGGGIVGGPVNNISGGEIISQITVTQHPGDNTQLVPAPHSDGNTQSVPEPSATAGILAFVALSTGSLIKRNMKRKGILTNS